MIGRNLQNANWRSNVSERYSVLLPFAFISLVARGPGVHHIIPDMDTWQEYISTLDRESRVTLLAIQAFRVFSQHPKWVYYTGKLKENAVYRFEK